MGFQPMLLHSMLVSTMVSTHMLLDTMVATTHMLVMVLIHMPLPHTPMLLLQLPRKNKGIQSFVHISGKYQNYENIVFIEDFLASKAFLRSSSSIEEGMFDKCRVAEGG